MRFWQGLLTAICASALFWLAVLLALAYSGVAPR